MGKKFPCGVLLGVEGFHGDLGSKESTYDAGDSGSIPGSACSPEQPIPVFSPREFDGHRSLVGYSPWGRKESDITKRLTLGVDDEKKTPLEDGQYMTVWQVLRLET